MIDYQKITDSIKYYTNLGYEEINVPIFVPQYISDLTKPVENKNIMVDDKMCLVGSAEQSFLYQYLQGFLPKGKYQATTPCFRDDNEDYFHQQWFIKNEIFITQDVNEANLNKLVNEAYYFFKQYIEDIKLLKTEKGYDIVYLDYELGSFYKNSTDFCDYICGTACAEPRLSNIIKLIK